MANTFGTLPIPPVHHVRNNEDMSDTRAVHDFPVEGEQGRRQAEQQEARRLLDAPQDVHICEGFRREITVSVDVTEAGGRMQVGNLRVFRGENENVGSITMTLADKADVFLLRRWISSPSQASAQRADNNCIRMGVVDREEKLNTFEVKVKRGKRGVLLELLQELGIGENIMS